MFFPGLADDPGVTEDLEKLEPAPEYEIVVGRRQIASLTFLAIVLLAIVAGGSYLIGKATPVQAMDKVLAATTPPPPKAAPVEQPPPAAEPAPQPAAEQAPEKPLFGTPIKGVVYIQMGAVEKGIAEIFAEGLRKRGFDSFVATGPNDHIFRVLIGPFKGGDEYDATKKSLDGMGLNTFARRYEE